MPKIVIVGAGSFVFSTRLTADILSYASTRDAEFALVDIDKERLDYASRIIERIFKFSLERKTRKVESRV